MLLWSWIRDWGDIYMQHCIFTNKFIVAQSHFRAALTQPCKDDLKVLMSESQVTMKSGHLYDLFPVISSSLCYWDIQYNGGRRFDHDAPAGRERTLRIIHMIMFWHLVLNIWHTSSNQVYTMGKLLEEYSYLCISSWYYFANDNSVNLNRWLNRSRRYTICIAILYILHY